MKIFTTQNLIFLIVTGLISLVVFICILISHKKFVNSIKEMKADNYYRKNSKFYLVNVVDNRRRIYFSKNGMNINIDPFIDRVDNSDGYDPNLTLRTYIPKEKNFGFKRFLRVVFIILFSVSFVVIVLSSILMLSEFFHQDLLELLHMEYTRNFIDYFKEYDVVFVSFFINALCATAILTISDTIKVFQAYSPFYLRKFNQIEYANTYSPVIIEIK